MEAKDKRKHFFPGKLQPGARQVPLGGHFTLPLSPNDDDLPAAASCEFAYDSVFQVLMERFLVSSLWIGLNGGLRGAEATGLLLTGLAGEKILLGKLRPEAKSCFIAYVHDGQGSYTEDSKIVPFNEEVRFSNSHFTLIMEPVIEGPYKRRTCKGRLVQGDIPIGMVVRVTDVGGVADGSKRADYHQELRSKNLVEYHRVSTKALDEQRSHGGVSFASTEESRPPRKAGWFFRRDLKKPGEHPLTNTNQAKPANQDEITDCEVRLMSMMSGVKDTQYTKPGGRVLMPGEGEVTITVTSENGKCIGHIENGNIEYGHVVNIITKKNGIPQQVDAGFIIHRKSENAKSCDVYLADKYWNEIEKKEPKLGATINFGKGFTVTVQPEYQQIEGGQGEISCHGTVSGEIPQGYIVVVVNKGRDWMYGDIFYPKETKRPTAVTQKPGQSLWRRGSGHIDKQRQRVTAPQPETALQPETEIKPQKPRCDVRLVDVMSAEIFNWRSGYVGDAIEFYGPVFVIRLGLMKDGTTCKGTLVEGKIPGSWVVSVVNAGGATEDGHIEWSELRPEEETALSKWAKNYVDDASYMSAQELAKHRETETPQKSQESSNCPGRCLNLSRRCQGLSWQ
ncbi:hypothetical protein PspLS_01913 [Pyricularia sp. CBS 133598]|nr:hypothetical protein PspLS_01913 [Pyricularia sp. CBS 133598]